MEPTTGIEPVNLFLTKEALYRLSYVGTPSGFCPQLIVNKTAIDHNVFILGPVIFNLERETRLELATSSLEG
jgi:hypothetical protein